jgi:flagellar basal-body rod modification protein FlgD
MALSIADYIAGQKPATNTVEKTVAGNSATASGKESLATSYQTFLTLLTSQLKNQDPLKPMDTDQFTQQIVQMTGVEQQLLSNDLLQKLVSNSSSGSNLNAVGLIGKTVTASTADTNLKDGVAKWTYEFDGAAKDASIEIRDAKGALVWKGDAPSLDSGQHDFSWNGKTADGVAQTDGVYTMKVIAHDKADALMTYKTYSTGVATALEQANGDTVLRIGGVKVGISAITGVRDQTAA